MHTAFNASTSVLCMVRVERYSAIEVELGFTSRSREHAFSNRQSLLSSLYIDGQGSTCRLHVCPWHLGDGSSPHLMFLVPWR